MLTIVVWLMPIHSLYAENVWIDIPVAECAWQLYCIHVLLFAMNPPFSISILPVLFHFLIHSGTVLSASGNNTILHIANKLLRCQLSMWLIASSVQVLPASLL